MAILGAIILLLMGAFSIFNKNQPISYPESTVGSFFYFFTKGAFLNILNPANFLFVLSTTAYLKATLKFSFAEIIQFFGASLFATFIAESLIALYAFRIKRYITVETIRKINIIAGLAFILIAFRMLWKQFL
jgi:L-lysine exporter family protein LysE/ArgO